MDQGASRTSRLLPPSTLEYAQQDVAALLPRVQRVFHIQNKFLFHNKQRVNVSAVVFLISDG